MPHEVLLYDASFGGSSMELIALATGKVLWHSSTGSTDFDAACTEVVLHKAAILFGCTCGEEKANHQDASYGNSSIAGANSKDSSSSSKGGGSSSSSLQRDPDDARSKHLCVYAISAAAGELMWRTRLRPLHSGDDHAFRSGPIMGAEGGDADADNSTPESFVMSGTEGSRMVPIISGGRILVLPTSHGLHALDVESGSYAWGWPVQPPALQQAQLGILPAWEGSSTGSSSNGGGASAASPPAARQASVRYSTAGPAVLLPYDTLASTGNLVLLRASSLAPGVPNFYILHARSGTILGNYTAHGTYGPPQGKPALPFDVRGIHAYFDACSGASCCLYGIGLNPDIQPSAVGASGPGAAAAATSAGWGRSTGAAGSVYAQLVRMVGRKAGGSQLAKHAPADSAVGQGAMTHAMDHSMTGSVIDHHDVKSLHLGEEAQDLGSPEAGPEQHRLLLSAAEVSRRAAATARPGPEPGRGDIPEGTWRWLYADGSTSTTYAVHSPQQLQALLQAATAAAAGAVHTLEPRAEGGGGEGGQGGAAASWEFCFSIAQSCERGRERGLGVKVVYLLLLLQVRYHVCLGSLNGQPRTCRKYYNMG